MNIGNDDCSERVLSAVEQILAVWNPRVLYPGCVNAKKLELEMRQGARVVENIAGATLG